MLKSLLKWFYMGLSLYVWNPLPVACLNDIAFISTSGLLGWVGKLGVFSSSSSYFQLLEL
jgi:hypothetical protein